MTQVRPEVEQLLQRAATGDAAAWGALLTEHEERLRRVVAFRMDARLRGRIDACDVVQEAYLAAAAQRAEFFELAAEPPVPLFLWLRGIVGNKLLELHRHHLGTKMRDAARDRALHAPAAGSGGAAAADATADALVAQLTGGATGPGTAAARGETVLRLREALAAMESVDREVLALRHYEQLTNAEAARVLGIQERAAATRYLRALERLKEMLAEMPGGLTVLRP